MAVQAETIGAKVSFVESFTQPNAAASKPPTTTAALHLISDDEENNNTGNTTSSSLRKRPNSILIGGDLDALSSVRTVHSPRSAAAASPSAAAAAHSLYDRSSSSNNERGAWRSKLFRSGWTGPADVLLSITVLLLSMRFYGSVLLWNETRSDIASFAALSDPLLPYITAMDCSLPLSVLVYGSLVAALKYTYKKPDLLCEFLQTHAAIMWVRMLMLFLTPLEAPLGTIPLVDPIAHGKGVVLVRDLFFSGHTATTFGLFICTKRHDTLWKGVFGCVTLATAALVLVQKAHYTIDVVAAPCFVYTTHSVVMAIRRQVVSGQNKQNQKQGYYSAKSPSTKQKNQAKKHF